MKDHMKEVVEAGWIQALIEQRAKAKADEEPRVEAALDDLLRSIANAETSYKLWITKERHEKLCRIAESVDLNLEATTAAERLLSGIIDALPDIGPDDNSENAGQSGGSAH